MSHPPSFWQAIVLRAFRVPIRLAYAFGSPSLQDLQHLMKAALVEELRDQGHTIREVSVALGCSEYWASQLVKKARDIGDELGGGSTVARMVERLKEGPATEAELMELLPYGARFRVDTVALAVLVKAGIAERVHPRSRRIRLAPTFASRSETAWATPLKEAERAQLAATAVVRALYDQGPMTVNALRKAIRGPRSAGVVEGALGALRAQGLVQATEGPGEVIWDLATDHLKLIPPDRAERIRTGLIGMFDGIGLATERTMRLGEAAPLGQRTLRFKARPGDLERFIREHGAETMDRVHGMDAAADADGGGVDCAMVWIVVGEG